MVNAFDGGKRTEFGQSRRLAAGHAKLARNREGLRMSGVGTRIKKAREALGMTQVNLARAVGVSQQAVMELESGRAKGTKHTAKFARALGQDPLWLETGDGRMREPAKAKRQARAEAHEAFPELADYERIPLFDMRSVAGRHALANTTSAIGFELFASAWLRQLSPSPFSQLAVLAMSGDSMEPTLGHGDHALVDTAQVNLRREGIYVLRLEDTLLIRRVSMHPATMRVTIAADNARYQPYTDLDPDALEALGRVIWIGRVLG
jgi:phage repressor protein C with HTH and peptisase S24 domain